MPPQTGGPDAVFTRIGPGWTIGAHAIQVRYAFERLRLDFAPKERGPTMSVVWLTGPAGAGKSTLARAIRALVHPVAAVAVLDEDDIEGATPGQSAQVFGNGRTPAAQLSQTARVLAQQGFVVVVSSSDTDLAVLAWNRENLPGYCEVYLRASLETIRRRRRRRPASGEGHSTQRALRADAAEVSPPVDGAGQSAAPPPHPDLTIDMDEPEPPELLAFRAGVLIPEFIVAAAGVAGLSRPWPGHRG